MEGFTKPAPDAAECATRHLYVANCGSGVNVSLDSVKAAFGVFGAVVDVCEADATGTRVVVSYERAEDAAAARDAWNRRNCELLDGLVMVIQYAVPRQKPKLAEQVPVFTSAAELEIPGLFLFTDFVSPEEEAELLQAVDARPWQLLVKRRVQHYGFEFLYKVRNVDTTKALGGLPDFVQPLLEKFSCHPELVQASEITLPFDQLTVNEYPRGVGLSPHIDTHSAFQGSIISLSLAGSCAMEFRKYKSDGDVCESKDVEERKALFLPQRSLLILSKEARYGWHHYIPHHKVDFVAGQGIYRSSRRVSYTFRKVRVSPCCCNFPQFCDSQAVHYDTHDVECVASGKPTAIENALGKTITGKTECQAISSHSSESRDEEMDDNLDSENRECDVERLPLATPEIEKTYVHKVYDAIAPHFSSTRFAKWPKVAAFLDSLSPGSLVVDAGCGNGKYLGLNRDCFFVGCDISAPLVSICSQRGHEVFVGDALNIPFRTGCFDAAISIAVLHHLSTESRRRRAILELLRVACKGGKILVTVWAAEQEDKKLITKWTPLSDECMEEWVDDMSKDLKRSSSKSSLKRIDEGGDCKGIEAPDEVSSGELQSCEMEQQEFFVPWHLPYHRAEIAGASAAAVASGFARKDDKKSAVVYNRYYHVFVKGELERLVSTIEGAVVIDQFYDKSNWCLVLQKL